MHRRSLSSLNPPSETKMRALIFLFVYATAVSALHRRNQSPRIVGGEITTIEKWPEMAAFLFSWDLKSYHQVCGATIINNRSLLTAAHCFGYSTLVVRTRVRLGSTYANSGGFVYNIGKLIYYPYYDGVTQDSDLGIMQTTTTITFNEVVRPAPIPGTTYNLADNEVVWATGWGIIYEEGPGSEELREVQVWTINQQICSDLYGGYLTANMLCSGWLKVGGRDQCVGDSGGPLFHNGVLVGVCSWGGACGQPHYPGVNVRVSRFTEWIVKNA